MNKDFTREEIAYLRSVPAVKRVAKNRITYARTFQLYCMARYLRGDGPTAIFRSVGLDPNVIGRKRIERCIARWKQDEQLMAEARQMNPNATPDVRDNIILMQCTQIEELTQQLSDLQKRLAGLAHKLNE
ncbi:HTH domain-containing protein [Bifidobacterium moukalabense]|uniref:HTH domain-containing protein n=1 Tax=Bifidobacterium moukalabense TaxID=1333651 RepID=UPI0010F5524A|nr:HTH domain-containing protein [Bifidobacterium moukalabense]